MAFFFTNPQSEIPYYAPNPFNQQFYPACRSEAQIPLFGVEDAAARCPVEPGLPRLSEQSADPAIGAQ